LAGISAPNSSAIVSADGTRVLIMLSTNPQYDQAPTTTLPDGRVINLRDTFTSSGLYDVSTLHPIWRCNWFSLNQDLLWSSDLRYVTRLNRQGFGRDWAIVFYDLGTLEKKYSCDDLLTGLKGEEFLPYSTWDWHRQWYEDFDLSSDGQHVLLSTARRRIHLADWDIDLGLEEFYTFNLADGSIAERQVTGRWYIWAYGGVASILALIFGYVTRWFARKIISSRNRGAGFPVLQSEAPGISSPEKV
jgi:hypothetical protein